MLGEDEDEQSLAASLSGQQQQPASYWKQHLYLLQEQAPRPRAVQCAVVGGAPSGRRRPLFYGREFHGMISRQEAEALLAETGDGGFLVRESGRCPGTFTLCMRFDDRTLNYKLFYDGRHFVGEKRFDQLTDLVADGLICMFMEKHAADYIRRMTDEAIYEQSPYIQYQRMTQRSRRNRRRERPSLLNKSTVTDGATSIADQQQQVKSADKVHWNNNAVGTPPSRRTENAGSRHSVRSSSESIDELTASPGPARKHNFKPYTFRIHYCDYCGNFLWGLTQQGLRCEDCGFAAHRKCAENTVADCQPDLKYVKRQFGVDVQTLCLAHECSVPPVVELCLAEVEKRGLHHEGLYRVSASHEDVEKLRLAFDTCSLHQAAQLLQKAADVHSVASLLKLYLRLLPRPLLSLAAYRTVVDLMSSAKAEEQQQLVEEVRHALAKHATSNQHQATLRLLCLHLRTVTLHSCWNKMTVDNIATIFAPTLFAMAPSPIGSSPLSPLSLALMMPHQEQQLLRYLIQNSEFLFG